MWFAINKLEHCVSCQKHLYMRIHLAHEHPSSGRDAGDGARAGNLPSGRIYLWFIVRLKTTRAYLISMSAALSFDMFRPPSA